MPFKTTGTKIGAFLEIHPSLIPFYTMCRGDLFINGGGDQEIVQGYGGKPLTNYVNGNIMAYWISPANFIIAEAIAKIKGVPAFWGEGCPICAAPKSTYHSTPLPLP